MSDPWNSFDSAGPIIATAIHNGHDMRADLLALTKLDDDERLREEDPHTGVLAEQFPTHLVVEVSRFEVDLNRPREQAVYRRPEDAWGLDLWKPDLTDEHVERSLGLYDEFYERIGEIIESAIDAHGCFVVYDIHSYNHRRGGPNAPADDPAGNPTVNLGTGSLPDRWRPVADSFMGSMAAQTLAGEQIDTRENVRFKGGHLSQWVHENYGDHGCALAIEFKKVFMEEWTGRVDDEALAELRAAVGATAEPVVAALRAT